MGKLSKATTIGVAVAGVLVLLSASGCDDAPLRPSPPPIDSPEALIQTLSRAYQQRDPDLLASILAHDADHQAEYLFYLSDPFPGGEESWDYTEEVRIHQRMFRPQAPLPGDTPVPPELWIQSLQVTLTPVGSFTERSHLYVREGGSLDEGKWRATGAKYSTHLLLELAGETDYRVDGESSFVVLEDLERPLGEGGKFLILIWEDLGSPTRLSTSESSWTAIKRLYR